MDIFRLTGVVDLKIDEFKAKAKEFEANIEKLENKLLELRKAKLVDGATKNDLIEYNKEISKTNVELKEQRMEYARLKTEVNRYVTTTKEATKAQTQFRSQVGASNSVALEFNRIIQDAPFGIIGIGNNIQQLTANYAQLRATSTSAGQALSQVFASIISPANLVLLGVSAVTSAFTAYQLGVFDSKEETKEFVSESERLAEILSTTEKALGAVERARLGSGKGAQEELVQLELLNSVLTDTNRSQTERVRAFSLLQETYPRILGNMTAEKALAEGIGDAYFTISQAIIQRATAIAIEEELVRIAKERFTLLKAEAQETDYQISLERQRQEILGKIAERGVQVNQNARELADVFGDQTVDFALVDLGQALVDVNNEFSTLGLKAGETSNALKKNSADTANLSNEYKSLNMSLLGLLDPLDKADESQRTYVGGIELTRESVRGLVQDLDGYVRVLQLIKDQSFEEDFMPKPLTSISKGGQQKEFDDNIKRAQKARDSVKEIGFEIDKIFASEALGGNPFSFLVDSIFKFREAVVELNNTELLPEEKMELLRERTLLLGNIFSGLGDVIANTFFRGNREMGRFVSALGDFVGQSIILAQNYSKAKSIEASASAVAGAAQSAQATGPAAIFTLAPFIASALALVSTAFSSFGGRRSGGGGFAGASASASTNAMGRTFSAGGLGFGGFGNFELTSKVSGTDIKLVLTRTETANA